MNVRQAFTRESADTRRDALIAACGRCLAKLGAQGTSVRAICLEAGVSPGLLRHYFEGVDALIAETYRTTGERVAAALNAAVNAKTNPKARLLAFVTASFREPVANPELLSTWLAFWSLSRTNPVIGKIHEEIYADNRRDMESLIAACSGAPEDVQMAAVALTALVDGLWLELTLGNASFNADQACIIAENMIESILSQS